MYLIDPTPHISNFWPAAGFFASALVLFVILDVVLKAVSLWKSARANQMAWFIALLVFNTLGILPILYLLFFAQKEDVAKTKTAKKTKKTKKN